MDRYLRLHGDRLLETWRAMASGTVGTGYAPDLDRVVTAPMLPHNSH